MHILKVCFYGLCGITLLLSCLLIGHLKADSPALIISEIKVRNDPNGFDEYIELYNPGSSAVSLNDYFIGYANTANPSADQTFSRYVIAQGLLEAGHYFVLAKNETDTHLALAQKSPLTSLSDAGGTVQISDQAGAVVDEVHWTGTAAGATGVTVYMPGTTAAKSQSISRTKTAEGAYMITPANWQLGEPTPLSSSLLPLVPTLSEAADQSDPAVDDQTDTTNGALEQPQTSSQSTDLEITELLPNPAAPATDDVDEYIELHNNSAQAINVKGYTLQSGNAFTFSYVLPDYSIQPDQYAVFKVSQTHLLLSNSGGHSRLLAPGGEVISVTDAYGVAAPGKAWALIDDSWQWTSTPTPGASNVASTTADGTKTTTLPKSVKVTKKAASKGTSPAKAAPKAKTTSTSKAKPSTAKAKKSNTPTSNKNGGSGTNTIPGIHPLVLAGVGVSTVLYGLYEYRQDIGNTLRRLRGNRSLRREIGSQAQGSGSD